MIVPGIVNAIAGEEIENAAAVHGEQFGGRAAFVLPVPLKNVEPLDPLRVDVIGIEAVEGRNCGRGHDSYLGHLHGVTYAIGPPFRRECAKLADVKQLGRKDRRTAGGHGRRNAAVGRTAWSPPGTDKTGSGFPAHFAGNSLPVLSVPGFGAHSPRGFFCPRFPLSRGFPCPEVSLVPGFRLSPGFCPRVPNASIRVPPGWGRSRRSWRSACAWRRWT